MKRHTNQEDKLINAVMKQLTIPNGEGGLAKEYVLRDEYKVSAPKVKKSKPEDL